MSAIAIEEAPVTRQRLAPVAARVLRTEIRHSAFLLCIPLLVVLFIYDPYRTAESYPALWPLRSTVVLNKFWPDIVVFAAGFSAWSGTREGRRNVSDLLATTARPAWTRQLCALAGTAFWVVATFLAGVIVLDVRTAQVATWAGPNIWPVIAWPLIVGVIGMLAVCAVAFTLGALFPGRFTAPIVAVAITIVTLYAFRQAVGDNGGSTGAIGVLSPDGSVPGNDWGLFYPVSAGVPVVQAMFMAGVILAALGVLGLSPRTGGVGWRGALSAVSAGGARLRGVAVSAVTAGVALAVAGVVLAGTANVSDPDSTLQIPAIDGTSAARHAIGYTLACSGGAGPFRVCVHPAYQPYLSWVTAALDPIVAQVPGLPGVPASAREVPAPQLPPAVSQGFGVGQVDGGTYEFTLGALPFSPKAPAVEQGFQMDLVHAIVVGSLGKFVTAMDGSQLFEPDSGTPAQLAVMDGLLEVAGATPFKSKLPNEAQVIAAAAKFADLPAASRHAWLAANLAAVQAGTITLAQVP
jgi:hypothetical protein